jgi:hypothetical protein
MCMSDDRRGLELVIGFIKLSQLANTSNCDSLIELRTPNITVTTGHVMSSLSSLVVA